MLTADGISILIRYTLILKCFSRHAYSTEHTILVT